ncbi:MAG: hypothetical protein UIQ67_05890, partial [Bacteroidales bacterium]|nr:hypothetical protein [Bacteroidales bacterium]
MSWNKGLRKIVAFAMIVSYGFLSISCCKTKEILQPTVRYVESHSIDTCFVFRTDTAFVWETDTLRIETLIRDTVIRQRIETKPIIIRDTVTLTVPAKPIHKELTEKEPTLCEMIIGV